MSEFKVGTPQIPMYRATHNGATDRFGPPGKYQIEVMYPFETPASDVQIGDHVSIVGTLGDVPTVMAATVTDYDTAISFDGVTVTAWIPRGALQREGVDWCRGWDGPVVEALKAAVALL